MEICLEAGEGGPLIPSSEAEVSEQGFGELSHCFENLTAFRAWFRILSNQSTNIIIFFLALTKCQTKRWEDMCKLASQMAYTTREKQAGKQWIKAKSD